MAETAVTNFDEALGAYLTTRLAERHARIDALLAAMTKRERALVRGGRGDGQRPRNHASRQPEASTAR